MPRPSGPRSQFRFFGTTRRCHASARRGWNGCPTRASGGVIDYIEASLASEISLRDLADVACLSPHYFLSAFKKATGKTPHRFLIEMRIAKSRELLMKPQMSIAAVALAVGFSSQSHFTTVFGRLTKTTPASYRAHILQ